MRGFKLNFDLSVSSLSLWLDERRAAWLKGFAVLLVMLDHNDFLRVPNTYVDRIFQPFILHVLIFFIVAFPGAYLTKRTIDAFIVSRFKKYYRPFIIFYLLYFTLYILVTGAHVGFHDFAIGAIFGSMGLVKKGCGAAFMWFLPSLFGFSLILSIVGRFGGFSHFVFVILSFLGFFLIPALPESIKIYQPIGALLTFYVCGVIVAFLYFARLFDLEKISKSTAQLVGIALVSVLSFLYIVISWKEIEIGSLSGPGYSHIWISFLQLSSLIFGLLFLFSVKIKSSLLNDFFVFCGKNSLIIYLIHPLFLKIFLMFSPVGFFYRGQLFLLLTGLLQFAFTLTAVLICIALINNYPRVRKSIFAS
jgi:Acyltransferase family